ncbi:hypothetical protein SPICUR_05490 [Spiribacter curvatus]|uniref:Zinc resistance-associated protein n=1 Tax=Spiribacter curvatus TaxID=1335757 RepID=U5T758_9GAMM|nr:hypothetical protein [Spiribacter curvatus]AGY92072.1 hypothetical protein SPICUR_05490 [Spiribacter curvatus]
MQILKSLILALTIAGLSGTALAQHSEYRGDEDRAIKSLSADDIEALRRGGGWGLARVAELNGVPGPSHLLELTDEINLDADQQAAIENLFTTMQAEAIAAGERFIAAEAALESAFQSGDVTPNELRDHLDTIAERRSDLRYVHLEAHLETLDIITDEQVARYNEARGYSTRSDCDDVPEGHDPEMWRQHQGCE